MKKLLDKWLSVWFNTKIEWARSQGFDAGVGHGYKLGQLGDCLPNNLIIKAWDDFNGIFTEEEKRSAMNVLFEGGADEMLGRLREDLEEILKDKEVK